MTAQSETITCPKCGHQFAVADALSEQIRNSMRAEMQKEILQRENQFAEQRLAMETEAKKLAEARGNIDAQVESRLKEKLAEAEKKAAQKIGDEFTVRLAEMQQALQEREKQVQDFRQQELALRQKQRELEQGKEALELDVERRLSEEREKMRNDVSTKIQEEHRRKDLEKDKVINDLKASLEDMTRKATQGSMETQGEVLEQDMEDRLRRNFPFDEFRAIKKGEKGADLVQTVRTSQGQVCGTILWEIKNTKDWGKGWIQKLKDDMMREKADIGIITSVVMYADIRHFGPAEGIWISEPEYALALAVALRGQLIAVAQERIAATGKNEKVELIHHYFAGPEFRQKIQSLADVFMALGKQLLAERAAMERQWKERQNQIDRMLVNTAHLFGDVRAMIGAEVQDIAALQLGEGTTKEISDGSSSES